MTSEEAEDEWANARSFSRLCELTAQWLEGKLPFYPGYASESPDPETTELIPILAAFNRAGFLTEFSQPAEGDCGSGSAQRAAVAGFAMEPLAKQIGCLSLSTDLYVGIFPPNVEWGYQLPISMHEFRPTTWCGATINADSDPLAESCRPEASAELGSCWLVQVIDLRWGRKSHLWSNLKRAIGGRLPSEYSVEPLHSETIGDFIY